jgi:dTDP-L-rhamnose 4-epimerase
VAYEDGLAVRDYVNIHDVVAANELVLDDERAAGRVFNVGGGTPYTTAQFADVVREHYGSDRPARISGEYRFGDTRHIISDIEALGALGWKPTRTPADSVAEYAAWLRGMPDLDRILAEADAKMRSLGVVRKALA